MKKRNPKDKRGNDDKKMKAIRFISCILAVFSFLITLVWTTDPACTQREIPDLMAYLENNLGFSKQEIGEIDTNVVVKQVYTSEKEREITLVGIVRITVPEDFFVTQFRNIKSFMQNDKLQQIGTFSKPPKPDDLATFQLPPGDLKEIAKCKIGNCKVKLPARTFDHLLEIDWSAGDAAERVTDIFRKGATNYLRSYLKNGNSSLMVYADKEKPLALAEGFNILLAQASYIYRYIPELYRYLEEFPRSAPSGVDNLLYWSVEDFGQRPTTTITHATIYKHANEANSGVTIALKQIYTSHYFQARFQLMTLVDSSMGFKEPGINLVYIDRLLFDENLNWASRKLISITVTSHMKSWLTAIRNRLQVTYKNTKEKAKLPPK